MGWWFSDFVGDDDSLRSDDLIVESGATARGYATGAERDLLTAILFNGVHAYLNYRSATGIKSRARFREASSWVHARDDDDAFAFENVCQALGIDPDSLRCGLANVTVTEALMGKIRYA